MNLLAINATGNITGAWLPFAGNRLGVQRVHFFIDGTHGGATYRLRWRPIGNSTNGMLVAQYTAPGTDLMVSVDLAPGEVQVEVSGGAGVNAMPELLY
jgi:hypothetical protein